MEYTSLLDVMGLSKVISVKELFFPDESRKKQYSDK